MPHHVPAFFLCLALILVGCGGEESSTVPSADAPGAGSGYATTPYAAGEGGGAAISAQLRKEADEAIAKARAYLVGAQAENGAWGDAEIGMEPNVGFTAMAVAALVASTPSASVKDDANIKKALDFLASKQSKEGAIFDNPRYVNYMTSAATGAFALAKIPAYREVQLKARDFIASTQISADESDPSYGGFPYKQDQGQASDLSNGQFAAQALADAELPKDHEVWKRLVTYLGRVQNRSETNDTRIEKEIDGKTVVVVSGDDGGAVYGPGMTKAGMIERSDGTVELRSYGSMTYALLKCLLLAGVDVEDPRVQAAFEWTVDNFTLEENPGFSAAEDPEKASQQGYYYYLYTVARTLAEYERATKKPLVMKDADGKTHAWRKELVQALLDRQRDEGWWVNANAARWDEGAPALCTGYALVALGEALGRFR